MRNRSLFDRGDNRQGLHMTRRGPIALAAIAMLAIGACGRGETPASKPEATAPAVDPMAAERQKQADAKAAFDAALAANDAIKMEDLAQAGNGFALLHRAQILLSSQDFNNHQSGVEDMEAAAAAGNAEAQLWVGSRMAEGRDGYPLKPNSGLIMVQKAADQGYGPAMLEVGRLYETSLMRDPDKAREWYKRAADAGVEGASKALADMDPPAEDSQP
ncbi:MAG: hypothetical protein GC155_17315 [Alphaproteobacteria bacterium]|nr:hypothetical protein [Alphaproteobacteria bacterium]